MSGTISLLEKDEREETGDVEGKESRGKTKTEASKRLFVNDALNINADLSEKSLQSFFDLMLPAFMVQMIITLLIQRRLPLLC